MSSVQLDTDADLLAGEKEGTIVVNETGASSIFLVCEHAGRVVPRSLDRLGLPEAELERHIAYDIGAEPVARGIAKRLDAPLVLQRYSRLVYDCNRPPQSPSAIPSSSELTEIPGNSGLTKTQQQARIKAIYHPFHSTVGQLIERRLAAGYPVIFVTIHSYTPVFKGITRMMHVGLLFDQDRRFTDIVGTLLKSEATFDVRYNEPYGPADGVCHTLNVQAGAKGLPYSMIEIRNDLIRSESGQVEWADRLAEVLQRAAAGFRRSTATAASRTSA
jgi:predicted N-formylglutamate amidohydrolase